MDDTALVKSLDVRRCTSFQIVLLIRSLWVRMKHQFLWSLKFSFLKWNLSMGNALKKKNCYSSSICFGKIEELCFRLFVWGLKCSFSLILFSFQFRNSFFTSLVDWLQKASGFYVLLFQDYQFFHFLFSILENNIIKCCQLP